MSGPGIETDGSLYTSTLHFRDSCGFQDWIGLVVAAGDVCNVSEYPRFHASLGRYARSGPHAVYYITEEKLI